jgi:membrane glycosyltransferase
MMNHAGSILSTLMGVDGGWRPQVRDRNGFAWSDLVRHYMQHMIFGFCLLLARRSRSRPPSCCRTFRWRPF